MPSANALVGKGMASQLASEIGTDYSSLTCAGTSQTTAAKVLSKMVELVAASSQTGAILPSTSNLQEEFNFYCSSSTSAVVYVPVGDNLNGSSNGSLTIAQGKAATIWKYKANNWCSILSA